LIKSGLASLGGQALLFIGHREIDLSAILNWRTLGVELFHLNANRSAIGYHSQKSLLRIEVFFARQSF
jgi:hypothetical protein